MKCDYLHLSNASFFLSVKYNVISINLNPKFVFNDTKTSKYFIYNSHCHKSHILCFMESISLAAKKHIVLEIIFFLNVYLEKCCGH